MIKENSYYSDPVIIAQRLQEMIDHQEVNFKKVNETGVLINEHLFALIQLLCEREIL